MKSDWSEFEMKTKTALEAIGYRVERNLSIKGNQIDLVATKQDSLVTNRLIVECKDYSKNISIEKIRSFSQVVASISTNKNPVSGLYVTKNGYTKEAKVFAESLNITLITLDELFNYSFNVTNMLQRIISKFKEDELSRNYISLSCQAAEHSAGTIYKPVEKFIDKYLYQTKRTGAIILGNFGTGKTSFAKHYSFLLADRFYNNGKTYNALPIYINLRDINNLHNIEKILFEIINNNYGANASIIGLSHWLKNKYTILILDGFDEMASKMDKIDINNNINSMFRFFECYPLSKLILTCRTHFFKTQIEENQFKDLLKLYIRDWGTDELTDYIKVSHPNNVNEVLRTIRNTYNLEELSKTPLFLDMISKTIEEIGDNINKSKLYKIYTDRWIESQDYRSHLSAYDKIKFMEELAFYLFSKGQSSIHYEMIPDILKGHFRLNDYKSLKQLDHDVRTCSFLVRTEVGEYYFVHKSFLEYFVSLKLAKEVKENNFNNFSIDILTIEIASFFSDYFEDETEFIRINILRNIDKIARANFSLVAGFLKYSDNLLRTLLDAIEIDEYEIVKLNAIDSLSNLSHINSINELVKLSYQEGKVGQYSLKVLSAHSNINTVIDRMKEVLISDKDTEKVTIGLECLNPIHDEEIDSALLDFTKLKWWTKSESIVISYINIVLNRKVLELVLYVDILHNINKNSKRIDKYIENAKLELSKKFSAEILKEAQINKERGISHRANHKMVNGKYKFLASTELIHQQITVLYSVKKITGRKQGKEDKRKQDIENEDYSKI